MNQMKKIKNKYMREIRNLFPALRREEKKYLRKMEENIADYLENECPPAAVSSVEDLRQIFGDPREIVHQYYSTMEADAFYSFLRVRRLMGRVALFICGLVLAFTAFLAVILYQEHLSVMRSEAFFRATEIVIQEDTQ